MGRSIVSGDGAGASGKPPCFSAGIFIPCWFFRRLRPEGNAGKQQAERTAVRAAPIVCPKESPCVFSPTTARRGCRGCRGASGKPPASSNRQQLCRKQSPMVGPDAPTPARGQGLQPLWGTHLLSEAIRRGAGGNEGKRVPSGHNRRRRLATRSSGKQQAERTAVRAASIVCPEESPLPASWATTLSQASPPVGNDAPTPARIGTGRPKGRSHFSFGGERKVCKRKPAARRLRGKSPLLPILTAGLAMSRATELARFHLLSCALGARLFPPPKWAGLFPSAAYRRSAPPQLARGRLTPCVLGCFLVAWVFLLRKRPA